MILLQLGYFRDSPEVKVFQKAYFPVVVVFKKAIFQSPGYLGGQFSRARGVSDDDSPEAGIF